MIRFDQVTKRYPGGFDALRGISFRIEQGAMSFITGHSGAGKSTVLKLIAAMERPTRGQVIVNQRNLNKIRSRAIPYYRRQLGVVFQDHRLLMDRTVFDNVSLPLVVAGVEPREAARRVRAALDKVNLLKKERALPITLSGGEQQRVGIARAVVNKPDVLLADEPTGNLDAELSTEIMNLLHEFNHHGVTVLIATHDLEQVRRLALPVITLSQGEIVAGGDL
jgi:cell division transport system ATP-binding protein